MGLPNLVESSGILVKKIIGKMLGFAGLFLFLHLPSPSKKNRLRPRKASTPFGESYLGKVQGKQGPKNLPKKLGREHLFFGLSFGATSAKHQFFPWFAGTSKKWKDLCHVYICSFLGMQLFRRGCFIQLSKFSQSQYPCPSQ